MADALPLDRIDRAIARIETAIAAREKAAAELTRRHAGLRSAMSEAVTALDELIAREGK